MANRTTRSNMLFSQTFTGTDGTPNTKYYIRAFNEAGLAEVPIYDGYASGSSALTTSGGVSAVVADTSGRISFYGNTIYTLRLYEMDGSVPEVSLSDDTLLSTWKVNLIEQEPWYNNTVDAAAYGTDRENHWDHTLLNSGLLTQKDIQKSETGAILYVPEKTPFVVLKPNATGDERSVSTIQLMTGWTDEQVMDPGASAVSPSEGQMLVIRFEDNYRISSQGTTAGTAKKISLRGGSDWVVCDEDILVLAYNSGEWRELSRAEGYNAGSGDPQLAQAFTPFTVNSAQENTILLNRQSSHATYFVSTIGATVADVIDIDVYTGVGEWAYPGRGSMVTFIALDAMVRFVHHTAATGAGRLNLAGDKSFWLAQGDSITFVATENAAALVTWYEVARTQSFGTAAVAQGRLQSSSPGTNGNYAAQIALSDKILEVMYDVAHVNTTEVQGEYIYFNVLASTGAATISADHLGQEITLVAVLKDGLSIDNEYTNARVYIKHTQEPAVHGQIQLADTNDFWMVPGDLLKLICVESSDTATPIRVWRETGRCENAAAWPLMDVGADVTPTIVPWRKQHILLTNSLAADATCTDIGTTYIRGPGTVVTFMSYRADLVHRLIFFDGGDLNGSNICGGGVYLNPLQVANQGHRKAVQFSCIGLGNEQATEYFLTSTWDSTEGVKKWLTVGGG